MSWLPDAIALFAASASLAALFLVWVSIVLSLGRASLRTALVALLVVPAPPLAWRAGMRARATAMLALAVAYGVVRLAAG